MSRKPQRSRCTRLATMNLLAIREALVKELKTDTEFVFINTRLILRTGVDLNRAHERDAPPDRIAKVLDELRQMGFLKEPNG